MKRTTICYGQPYELVIYNEPGWAVAWNWFYESVLTALGSPCCDVRHGNKNRETWTAWIYRHLPGQDNPDARVRGWFDVAQFRLLNNRLTRTPCGPTFLRARITRDQALAFNAEFVADMDTLHLDDDAETLPNVVLPGQSVMNLSNVDAVTFHLLTAAL